MAGILSIVGMVLGLVGAIGGIRILIAAFQESVAQGLLTLCVPFYVFYFAFGVWKDEKKMMWIGLWLGGGIGNMVMQVAAGAMAG
ncbi:MAG: hypothetical protein ACYTGX_13225 [Planctomycetota bacterium]|jgi:lipoprotein signal peptidase